LLATACSSVPDIRNAELLVSRAEWRSLHRPLAAARGLLRSHIDRPGLRWRPVEFERLSDPTLEPFGRGYDVFGDGALTILPTPGHTSGSMSMLVRRPDGPPLLLVGDLTYDIHAFERGVQGGVGSRRKLRETRARVLALRERQKGMRILAAHDPAAARILGAA
jgi:glyoxylase-like metal-dependent hydrolase (beta-lactamase superfamily II)